MSENNPHEAHEDGSPIAADRLYVLWIISSLVVVLVIIVGGLMTSGSMRRYERALDQQSAAIDELRGDLETLQKQVLKLSERKQAEPARPARDKQPASPKPPESSQASPTPTEPATEQTQPPAPTNALAALLDQAVAIDNAGRPALKDMAAAQEALEQAQIAPNLTGRLCARLALVAALAGESQLAERFAIQAMNSGTPPVAYYEYATRQNLAADRITEATVFARRLREALPENSRANLLFAAALSRSGDWANAGTGLQRVHEPERLSFDDRLLFGTLLLKAERWAPLQALLAGLSDAPPARLEDVNRLRAGFAIHRNHVVEGLAIADELLAQKPEDNELRILRAAALIGANQLDAARTQLQDVKPTPEAWFWLGILELHSNDAERAIAALQQTLEEEHRHSPAWEALATIALNDGDLPSAGTYVDNAIAANPWRPSPHLLRAIVKAKANQREQARESLATAVQLDPTLIETAAQADILQSIATTEELRALLEKGVE